MKKVIRHKILYNSVQSVNRNDKSVSEELGLGGSLLKVCS